MNYVIEGVDRCGKSTQILKLKRWLESKGRAPHILHYSNLKCPDILAASKKHYKEMFDLMGFANKKGMDIIFDRAHLGEVVYSPKYRGYSGEYVYELEKKYLKSEGDACLILFVDDPAHLIERDDGLSFTTDYDKKLEEVNAFVEAFEKSNFKHKLFINLDDDGDRLDIDDVWDKLLPFVEVL
jgi:thymidylate kinase